MTDNPYLEIIHRNLPRLLAQYNQDRTDPYYGCGDRQYWAWKLIDFPNGTFQGAAYGLALMLEHDLLPDWMSEEACVERILAMVQVLPRLYDRNGALAEALPYEGSFCVTGLVLGDVLGALDLIRDRIPAQDYQAGLSTVTPMVDFLMKNDESHGMISNHLASAALAMVRWSRMSESPTALERAKTWIERIKKEGDLEEGWMSEYGTADPGYQSWCLSSLVQIHALDDQNMFGLKEWIDRGYRFLSYFAMPDGSFGNGLGGRLTRFLFPGGVEMGQSCLREWIRGHIAAHDFVQLDSIDAPNLIPFFNDMVLACVHWRDEGHHMMPYQHMELGQTTHFNRAGLLIYQGQETYSIINIHNGGQCLSMNRETGVREQVPAYLGEAGPKLYTARSGRIVHKSDDQIIIQSDLKRLRRMMPSVWSFFILRLASITVFQIPALGNEVKKVLAKLLIHASGKGDGVLRRTIHLKEMRVEDEVKDIALRDVADQRGFSQSHMASQGYWQMSDDS